MDTPNAILDKHNHLVGWRDEMPEGFTAESLIADHEAFDEIAAKGGIAALVDEKNARTIMEEGTVVVDEPVPWAEAAHDPCPECGVCQDAHGETRRQFHSVTCSHAARA